MITKTKVTVSDYFMLVVFKFNCNLGLKENSKINMLIFSISCTCYMVKCYLSMVKKNVF